MKRQTCAGGHLVANDKRGKRVLTFEVGYMFGHCDQSGNNRDADVTLHRIESIVRVQIVDLAGGGERRAGDAGFPAIKQKRRCIVW